MISLEEVFNRYLTGERDFSHIFSRYSILIGQNLSSINLSGATLDRVNLTECDLSNANLSKANIAGSILQNINFSQANLSQTNFCVDRSNDVFQMRKTMKANLAASLENLPSEIAVRTIKQMSEQIDRELQEILLPVILKNANLQGANLTNADLREADLRGADLREANLTGVNFESSNLSQANLTGAIVNLKNLQKATLNWTIMPDGSVRDNAALKLIHHKLNSLKRQAWFPVTIRQDGELTTSKFAGKPWLSEKESFPRCICCQKLMRFFFQLNLEQIPNSLKDKFGTGLLQLFYCVNCDDYASFSSSRLVRIIQPIGKPAEYKLPHFQDNWSDDSMVRNSNGQFPAKIIVNWQEITDYPDWRDAELAGASLNNDELKILMAASNTKELENFNNLSDLEREYSLLSRRSGIVYKVMNEAGMFPSEGDKLAGYPRWVQDLEYPNCPICNCLMNQLIFEFASDDNIPYLWGDVGTGYFLQCPEHKEQVTFLWQCG